MPRRTQSLKKKLIVEGDADKKFCTAFLEENSIPNVCVGPPTEFNGNGQGKGNAIYLLPTLIDELADGQSEKVALIIDADYEATNGLGFTKTFAKVQEILKDKGYLKSSRCNNCGFIFHHNDGLPSVGLWIMPNCKDDGFIEHFILPNMTASTAELLNDAKASVEAIKEPQFASHHQRKADMFTWLAWQEKPGQHLSSIIRKSMLDTNKTDVKNFKAWLDSLFS